MPKDFDEVKMRPAFETYFPHPAAEPVRVKRSDDHEPRISSRDPNLEIFLL